MPLDRYTHREDAEHRILALFKDRAPLETSFVLAVMPDGDYLVLSSIAHNETTLRVLAATNCVIELYTLSRLSDAPFHTWHLPKRDLTIERNVIRAEQLDAFLDAPLLDEDPLSGDDDAAALLKATVSRQHVWRLSDQTTHATYVSTDITDIQDQAFTLRASGTPVAHITLDRLLYGTHNQFEWTPLALVHILPEVSS